MKTYRATYRLQLQKNFQFSDAARIVDYLSQLGISHLYLSPILEAQPGSNHGYDAIDPSKISVERGGEAGFRKLLKVIGEERHVEGLILDIVPNHLSASWRNPAWWDVLRKGPYSNYWKSFDFKKNRHGDFRIVVPVLGRSFSACVVSREIRFDVIAERGFVFRYFDHIFPVNDLCYEEIIRALYSCFDSLSGRGSRWFPKLKRIREKMKSDRSTAITDFIGWMTKDVVARRGFEVMLRSLPLKILENTLERQFFLLEEWRTGSREINYRRFFDINDLVALRMEDPKTFRWSHAKIEQLIHENPVIHGLRVDHIDGLTDPEAYLKRIHRFGTDIWVEKILGEGESLPKYWKTRGTTGYDFLNLSARLFVDLPGLLHLQSHYTRQVDSRWERFQDCLYSSKREIIETHFWSELNTLSSGFFRVANGFDAEPRFSLPDLREALIEVTSSLRVYRSYFSLKSGTPEPKWLELALSDAEGRGKVRNTSALSFLREILLSSPSSWTKEVFSLVKNWEQLSGPVMAKGLEDTALYRYFPLLSLNVVGGEPGWIGDGAIEFHSFNANRVRHQPLSMNTTSTHDTKRSEDVRSRIHVISEVSEKWTKLFKQWHSINRGLVRGKKGESLDLATEYLIYETLIGVLPHDGRINEDLIGRVKTYLLKAAREAKSETSWIEPNLNYESEILDFVERLMKVALRHKRPFGRSFLKFADQCSYFGALNSLSLVTLKTLSPGLPDFYQGCELWNLSLVDPDNRREVDYAKISLALKRIQAESKKNKMVLFERLFKNWKTGEVKLWLTSELLRLRSDMPDLFIYGDYIALEPVGVNRKSFLSFMRKYDGKWVWVLVPRLLARKAWNQRKVKLSIPGNELLSTGIKLAETAPKSWRNALTGQSFQFSNPSRGKEVVAPVGEILDGLPIAILLNE